MKKIITGALVCTLFIILLTGCSKSSDSGYTSNPPAGSGNNISIYGMAFSPASKTVAKGTAVKWTNNDSYAHTVTSNDGTTFDSGNMSGGGTFSYTANTAGTFVCNHLIFGVLHHIAIKQYPIRAGFMHVPFLDSQVVGRRDVPSMPLLAMIEGTKAAIIAAIKHREDIKSIGGAHH